MDSNNEQNMEPSQTSAEKSEEQAVKMQPSQEKSFGPIIGIVIVVVLFVLGGLYYFFGYNQSTINVGYPSAEEIRATDDTLTTELGAQSQSDEIGAIEEDLNVGDFDGLDADLQNIDIELGL